MSVEGILPRLDGFDLFSQAMAMPGQIPSSSVTCLPFVRALIPPPPAPPSAQEAESAFPESILRPGFMVTPALCSLEDRKKGVVGRVGPLPLGLEAWREQICRGGGGPGSDASFCPSLPLSGARGVGGCVLFVCSPVTTATSSAQ